MMEMGDPISVAGKAGKAVRKSLMWLSLLFAHSDMIPTPVRAQAGKRVGNFLSGLARRSDEVKRRCRTVLQSKAEGLLHDP